MNTPDFAKILAESWPSFIGALVGAAIGHFPFRRPPDVQVIKRQLGRALDRFQDVPPERLDAALLSAAQAAQGGWRCVASIVGIGFTTGAAMFSAAIFRASFPAQFHWLDPLVAGLVAGLLAWRIQRIKRRAILRHLERLRDEPGIT